MKSLQCLNNGGGFFIFVFVCCKLSFQMKFTLLPAKKTQEEKKISEFVIICGESLVIDDRVPFRTEAVLKNVLCTVLC